jgi:Leucine-rich repeat (LRR) protein
MKKIILPLLAVVILSGCTLKSAVDNVTQSVSENQLSEKVDVSGQSLKTLQDDFFNKSGVTEFNVSNNLLTGALPSQIGKWSKLTLLNASNNTMTGIPAEIGQLTMLKSVDYSNNQIDTMPNEIVNLKKLETLSLAGNSYSQVPSQLFQLPNLKVLDLSRNKLTSLPADLSGWKNLSILVIGGNSLSAADLARLQKALPNTKVSY